MLPDVEEVPNGKKGKRVAWQAVVKHETAHDGEFMKQFEPTIRAEQEIELNQQFDGFCLEARRIAEEALAYDGLDAEYADKFAQWEMHLNGILASLEHDRYSDAARLKQGEMRHVSSLREELTAQRNRCEFNILSGCI